ncbi:hypothetical protein [Rhizobium sp. Root1204]|uniref:hypothetical protein n=1 Tax=Rhizobium sp. Root1204 TaxID=1736428 RepID=UPI001FCD4210|nr:hypothetical protein [Rhizobium sp. Root1204]
MNADVDAKETHAPEPVKARLTMPGREVFFVHDGMVDLIGRQIEAARLQTAKVIEDGGTGRSHVRDLDVKFTAQLLWHVMVPSCEETGTWPVVVVFGGVGPP